MTLTYDPQTDILKILLRPGVVHESDEARAGVILDFDVQGRVVSIEILDASRSVENPRAVEFRDAV